MRRREFIKAIAAGVAALQLGVFRLAAEPTHWPKFGTYVGNGSARFVEIGLRPNLLLVKRLDDVGPWMVYKGNEARPLS